MTRFFRRLFSVLMGGLVCTLLLTSCGKGHAGSSAAEVPRVRDVPSGTETADTVGRITADGEIDKALLLQTTGNTWSQDQSAFRFSYGGGETVSSFPSDWTAKIFHKDTLPDENGSVFITDRKTAVVCADGDALVIVYSDDQGKSWNTSQPIPANAIPFRASVMPGMLKNLDAVGCVSLSFVSDSCGYLLIGSQPVAHSQANRVLFRTTDGGQSWRFVDPELLTEDNGGWKTDSCPTAIPVLQGTGVINRLFFVDEELGFLCGYTGAEANTARIIRTRDGGKTGDVRTLPLPASGSDQWACVLTPYLQNGTIYLPVKISDGQTSSKILFFSSADQGETWVYEEAMNRSADTLWDK